MLNFAVVQISGRQYMVTPNKPFEVDSVPAGEKFKCDQVLMVDDGKLQVGTPFLKDVLTFDVLGEIKKKKIRVATYHAKANTRKVVGQRATKVRLVLA